MPLYQLENTLGTVLRVQPFDADPPILAPEKGLVWVPYVEPTPVPETTEQIKNRLSWAVQSHLDAKAREYRYESILSARTALSSTIPKFSAEGSAFNVWWGLVWAHVDQVEADVASQTRTIPTEAELLAELPAFVPPVY